MHKSVHFGFETPGSGTQAHFRKQEFKQDPLLNCTMHRCSKPVCTPEDLQSKICRNWRNFYYASTEAALQPLIRNQL